MSSNSLILSLPYIQQNQAQKHVTHNEALRSLDALVQLAVDALPQSTPPASPPPGMRCIVGAGADGAWAGHDGKLALFDGSWLFFDPVDGWRAEVPSAGTALVFRSGTWVDVGAVPTDNLDGIGIMTSFDATNRLAVAGDATLLTHAGGGHQVKLNKSSISDTASLVFQTAWGGRAEMGTVWDDDFSIKVSPDGGTWHTALRADKATGHVTTPRLSSGTVTIDNDAVGAIPTPGSGGFVLITVVDNAYPQAHHSGIFAYDTGSSRHLSTLSAASGMVNGGTGALSGGTGAVGQTTVAASAGALQVENRTGWPRTFSFTFLGGL